MNPGPPAPDEFSACAPLQVDLRQAICGFAAALGLVGVDERQHGERVAYMAVECGRRLDWSEGRLDDLFHAGLLHDCGVSSTRVHRRLVTELDWDGSAEHCATGAGYLESVRPLAHLAPIVLHHHSHWDELAAIRLPAETREASNLIYLADRVDALRSISQDAGQRPRSEQVRATIQRLAGSFFAPHLVDAFLAASASEVFWLDLEPLAVHEFVYQRENREQPQITAWEDLRDLARQFARIVDAKSRFTYEHSLGVARMSVRLAELAGLPPRKQARIEIAALLHDLGKLGVPDEILEKPGPLTPDEVVTMHRHSYDSYRILSRIRGFDEIAGWAASHHEVLNGTGYPFGHRGAEIPFEARLIAVADVFQALAQDRPYRAGMPPETVRRVLRAKVAAGELDENVLALVEENFDSCWRAANAA